MARTRSSVEASSIAGEEIRRARLEAGLTQRALADRMLVSAPFVARLESGRANPTVGQLGEVARALGAGMELRLVVLAEWEPTGMALGAAGGTRGGAASGQPSAHRAGDPS